MILIMTAPSTSKTSSNCSDVEILEKIIYNFANNILMGRSELVRLQQEYGKRYKLLRIKYPPLRAFIEDTLPNQGRNGEVIFNKALALKRQWSANHYQMKITERSQKDRDDCQVVVIPPRDPNNKNKDFSEAFYNDLKKNQLGKYPVARLQRQNYKGDTGDIGRTIVGQKRVKTVYIVASIVDDHDLMDVDHVASQYQMHGEDVEINLVTPFIKAERDDKNVELLEKSKKKKYTGKIISILTTMKALSPFINNIYTYETHSSATQAFAAMFGMDLVPISLYEDLLSAIKDKIVDPDDWRIVRPDIGRNMVARRLSSILKMKGVSLSKYRSGDSLESYSKASTPQEKKLLKNKNTLLYDDEGGTFGTIKDIVINHLLPAKVKNINILLGHGRLQRGWDKNLKMMMKSCKENNVSLKIYVTDSRLPIGDLNEFMEAHPGVIEIVSIAKKTRKVIETSISGVNFFYDNSCGAVNWEQSILQPIPGYDYKEKPINNGVE